jgi:thiosulfate/3-mercaptopyruvate sulfurtransferase
MASDVLVSTQWVADNLNNAKVKLIEVDVDTNAYDEGHAPGAVGFNWTSQLQDQVRRDIISRDGLDRLLSEAGVGNDDTVVLYGDNNNWFAAYAFWLLEMYGHKDIKLMDGGRKKWMEENRATTKDKPSPAKASYKAKDPDKKLRARRDDVLAALGK